MIDNGEKTKNFSCACARVRSKATQGSKRTKPSKCGSSRNICISTHFVPFKNRYAWLLAEKYVSLQSF